MSQRVEGLSRQLETLQADATRWRDAAGRAEAQLHELTAHLAQTQSRPAPEALGFELLDSSVVGRVWGWRAGAEDVDGREAPSSQSYRRFEDAFRGGEDLIRERQRVYLPVIDGREPVLDIGCGRGELLDLLREAGLRFAGVDLDEGMVDRCRQKEHDTVTRASALGYLAELADGSQGVITALQVVEHLNADSRDRLFALCARKLAPGGMLIVETVNPHAPQALKHFWLDATHHHPVFPEVALHASRIAGFDSAFVFHPGGSGDTDRDRLVMGDYALVAGRAG